MIIVCNKCGLGHSIDSRSGDANENGEHMIEDAGSVPDIGDIEIVQCQCRHVIGFFVVKPDGKIDEYREGVGPDDAA